MESALAALNHLKATSLITDYALGGAIAAYFYCEAILTEDLDAFILLEPVTGPVVVLTRVYETLRKLGGREEREYIRINGVLLQLLPAFDALTEEAVRQAVTRQVGSTETRVMRVEHLIAIALKTGRRKDHERIRLLLDHAAVDLAALSELLDRHGLTDLWKRLQTSVR